MVEDDLWESLAPALDEALDNLIKMRKGGNLWKDLNARLELIKDKVELIKERADMIPKEYKERLMQNVQRLSSDLSFDEDRIETEAVIFAEKSNITEEVVRLGSHLAQMQELLYSDDAVGKKWISLLKKCFARQTRFQ